MKEHRIEVTISPDGKVTADAEGFEGDGCLRDLEKLLIDLAASRSVQRPPRVRASGTPVSIERRAVAKGSVTR